MACLLVLMQYALCSSFVGPPAGLLVGLDQKDEVVAVLFVDNGGMCRDGFARDAARRAVFSFFLDTTGLLAALVVDLCYVHGWFC